MKKLLLNALFLGIVTIGFAQAAFTEKTFNEMMKGYETGREDFLKTQFTPDFILVGTGGSVFTLPEFMAFTKGGTTLTSDFSKVKIRQYDKTAIATGIWAHSHRLQNNSVVAYRELFTYTFIEQKGKWLVASAQHSEGPTVKADEEAAVKKALVDERKAFYAGDKDELTKLWTNNPATFINASYPSGRQFYRNSEAVKKSIEDFKPRDNAVGTITSSKVKVYGNNAIADLEVTANYKNGTVAKEHNIVLLEKEGDAWKILGYSTHGVALDKKDEEAAIKTVLEKETTAWNARDAEGMASCWANTEYALTAVYHGVTASNNGVAYYPNPKKDRPEAIKAMVASMPKPDGTTFKNENYVMNINGASAFVHFYETTTAGDGSKRSDYAIRYLEKINGEWKIVYVGGIKDK